MIEPLAKYHTSQTAALRDWESHWQAAKRHLEIRHGMAKGDANKLMHEVRVSLFLFFPIVDPTQSPHIRSLPSCSDTGPQASRSFAASWRT